MKGKYLVLPVILISYALLYIATSKSFPCEDDCQKVSDVSVALSQNRSYVLATYRCSWSRVSDTLCVYVKDTTGINWQLLADTTCMIATQKGLLQQKVFILKPGATTYDTVARKQCP